MAQQKIILDTDPGVDDVLAILMALASPEINVALISIVFGNTHAPVAHVNLLKIYHWLAQEIAAIPTAAARYKRLEGQEKTILALGEDSPIDGEKAVAAYFHGLDGLSNISETHPHFTPPVRDPEDHEHLGISKTPAYKEILSLLASEPEHSVTIVALGPLTNLAHAYRQDPTTFCRVHSVVWMGGALDHPGNTSPVAEFNCFADPYAATQIADGCRKGDFNLIMAPLDITTPHSVPFSDLIKTSSINATSLMSSDSSSTGTQLTPLREFISAMLGRVRGLHQSFGLPDAMEMHDPLAVWYAISQAGSSSLTVPEGWTLTPRDFQIERIGELTRGMCVVDRRGTGETNENRTKDHEISNGGKIPSTVDGERDRDGSVKVKSTKLPFIITATPGKEALRKLLLGRVFGET